MIGWQDNALTGQRLSGNQASCSKATVSLISPRVACHLKSPGLVVADSASNPEDAAQPTPHRQLGSCENKMAQIAQQKLLCKENKKPHAVLLEGRPEDLMAHKKQRISEVDTALTDLGQMHVDIRSNAVENASGNYASPTASPFKSLDANRVGFHSNAIARISEKRVYKPGQENVVPLPQDSLKG